MHAHSRIVTCARWGHGSPHVNEGRLIEPEHPVFSGFIFKIQANMDPKHRDRIAFVRVVSGKFERDMTVLHVQSGRNSLRTCHQSTITIGLRDMSPIGPFHF